MTTFTNSPEVWEHIIGECEKYFDSPCIIAGGAVRDYYLGLKPKDIDVFVWAVRDLPGRNEFESGDALQTPGCPFHSMEDPAKAAEYEAMNAVQCVWEGTLCEYNINVVLLDQTEVPISGTALISSFDFGICRSWFNGELHDSGEAKEDREMHKVTLLLKDRPERAAKRFERFNARAGGDWTFVQ